MRSSASNCARVGSARRPRCGRALTEHRGINGRDALWDHPDLLPSDDDFADPGAFAQSQLDLGSIEDFMNSLDTPPEPESPDDPS